MHRSRSTLMHSHPVQGRLIVLALLLAFPFVSASVAQAAPPPPPAVTLTLDGQKADTSGCEVDLLATWSAQDVHGAFVDTRFYEVTDQGDALVGGSYHIADTGSDLLKLHNVSAGTHAYRVELVRGGQDRTLASSDTLAVDVSCP
jgi:hypothetical protein